MRQVAREPSVAGELVEYLQKHGYPPQALAELPQGNPWDATDVVALAPDGAPLAAFMVSGVRDAVGLECAWDNATELVRATRGSLCVFVVRQMILGSERFTFVEAGLAGGKGDKVVAIDWKTLPPYSALLASRAALGMKRAQSLPRRLKPIHLASIGLAALGLGLIAADVGGVVGLTAARLTLVGLVALAILLPVADHFRFAGIEYKAKAREGDEA